MPNQPVLTEKDIFRASFAQLDQKDQAAINRLAEKCDFSKGNAALDFIMGIGPKQCEVAHETIAKRGRD